MPTINILEKKRKNITIFHLKINIFTAVEYWKVFHKCKNAGYLIRWLIMSHVMRKPDVFICAADQRLCFRKHVRRAIVQINLDISCTQDRLLPMYNHNEKQEALLRKFRQNICSSTAIKKHN